MKAFLQIRNAVSDTFVCYDNAYSSTTVLLLANKHPIKVSIFRLALPKLPNAFWEIAY